MKFRPLNDYVLVKFNKLAKRSDTIVLAGDHDTAAVRTGVVLRVGPGRITKKGKRGPMSVKAGDHITFFRWHQEHQPGKANAQVLAELGDDITVVRENDILFTYDNDPRNPMKVDV